MVWLEGRKGEDPAQERPGTGPRSGLKALLADVLRVQGVLDEESGGGGERDVDEAGAGSGRTRPCRSGQEERLD